MSERLDKIMRQRDRLLIDPAERLLRAEGFGLAMESWDRTSSGVVQHVLFKPLQGRRIDCTLSVNHLPSLQLIPEIFNFTNEAWSTVPSPLGGVPKTELFELVDPGNPLAFIAGLDLNAAQVAEKFARSLGETGLPWLECHSNLQSMFEAATSDSRDLHFMLAAALACHLGDRASMLEMVDRGVARMKRIRPEIQGWRPKAIEAFERIQGETGTRGDSRGNQQR